MKKGRFIPEEPWFTVMVLAYGLAILVAFATLGAVLLDPPSWRNQGSKVMPGIAMATLRSHPLVALLCAAASALGGAFAQRIERKRRQASPRSQGRTDPPRGQAR